jgi:hypothetical protein
MWILKKTGRRQNANLANVNQDTNPKPGSMRKQVDCGGLPGPFLETGKDTRALVVRSELSAGSGLALAARENREGLCARSALRLIGRSERI